MNKVNQNGGVYYDSDRNRWRVRFKVVDPKTSECKYKNKVFQTEQEAKDFFVTLQYQRGNNLYVENNGIPFNLLLRSIMDKKYESGVVSGRTYRRIEQTISKIEKCDSMRKNVDDITTDDIQTFLNSLRIHSKNTIDKVINQLNQGFKMAQNKGYIRINPMCDVIKPKSIKQTDGIRALELEEQQKLTNYLLAVPIYDEPYRNVFLFQMFFGLRIGEALALQLSDINLQKNIIYINKTITRDKDDNVIMGNTTKTYAGRREIPIPEFLLEPLKMQMQLAKEHKDNLLFVASNNSYANPNNVNRELKRIVDRLGIDKITTHSLRHTYGTRCIEAGMRAVAVQRLMGHQDVSVTLNTYTSIFNKYKEQELEKVNEYYLNNDFFEDTPLLDESEEVERE